MPCTISLPAVDTPFATSFKDICPPFALPSLPLSPLAPSLSSFLLTVDGFSPDTLAGVSWKSPADSSTASNKGYSVSGQSIGCAI